MLHAKAAGPVRGRHNGASQERVEPTAAKLIQNHFDYRRHIECTRSICEEQIDYRAMRASSITSRSRSHRGVLQVSFKGVY
jgi:hypothetical protein